MRFPVKPAAARSWLLRLFAGVILPMSLCCGCNWFKPLAFIIPPPKKKIAAEFAHLQGSVAVVTWVRPETLYDYPYARLEVAGHVADQIAAHVKPAVRCVDIFEIEDFLNRSNARAIDPEHVGRAFDTRFVVYLELLEFSFRDPHLPDLLQGHIRASVVVYDLTDKDLSAKTYDLATVNTRVPRNPVQFTQTSAAMIRKATYETFAGMVAKKFYDHQEVVE